MTGNLDARDLMFTLRIVAAGIVVVALCGVNWAYGQRADSTAWKDSHGHPKQENRLRLGIESARQGAYSRAISQLRPFIYQDSLSLNPAQRSAACYWIGYAYQETDRSHRALEVWRTGLAEQNNRSRRFSYRLVDAFIRSVMWQDATRYYPLAARSYVDLLERIDDKVGTKVEERNVLPHLRELAVVLPSDIQEETGIRFDRSTFTISVDRTANAGRKLVEWWRSQDPVPSTRQNERLFEHLRRASYARKEYSHAGIIDDRGKVFIRLGEPHRSQSIGMADQETTPRISTPIRRNEFWTYPQIDEKAYYLFVERDPGFFDLTGVMDLFPPSMMPGRDYLYELEEVLRELATFHGDYSLPAADVFARAAWSRDNEQYRIGSDRIGGSVDDFVQKIENQIQTADRQNAERRRQRVPISYTETVRRHPDFPVATRTARLLAPGGTTRLEIYWGIPGTVDLKAKARSRGGQAVTARQSDSALVLTTLVQEDKHYVRRQTKERRYRVPGSHDGTKGFSSYTSSIRARDSIFHVAAQWDEYVVQGGASAQLVRRQTARFDTLYALSSNPSVLEMSDLQLVTVPRGSPPTTLASECVPYPFERVDVTRPVGLRFEIYHLGIGDGGQSRYRVSYVINRQEDRGFFSRLFGDGKEETAVSTTHRTESDRATEYILLDLENLVIDNEILTSVSVTVTDKLSGRSISRSISFRAAAPETD